MYLKLANGVTVAIREDEGQKVLVFDQNVRAIALEPEEATQIGASLYRSKNTVILPNLVHLIESRFFDQARTFTDIRKELTKGVPNAKSSSLVMALNSLVAKQILIRSGKRGEFVYKKSKTITSRS